MTTYLIDTTIFTNLMNIPKYNQQKETVIEDYKIYSNCECSFILPIATIIETGNHIAQCGDGRVRRETAKRFIKVVEKSLKNEAPYKVSTFPEKNEIVQWLVDFPDLAGKNKIAKKEKNEGTSFGDLTIIKEFEKACIKLNTEEVWIWSLDSDLKCYHQNPK